MTGPIKIKREAPGLYDVMKGGEKVATISRSQPNEPGYRSAEPWKLEALTGRVDRFSSKAEAVDDAQKI